jgi:hypothetical protein
MKRVLPDQHFPADPARPEGEDHMSTLERHCQLVLRAYPAAYRKARGEEIIGTLLEATPQGRSWPLLRDIRCLIFGGLRARAAQPKEFTTAANLRVAVLAGVAAYLAYGASSALSSYVHSALMAGLQYVPDPDQRILLPILIATSGWRLAAVVLPLIPLALVWVSRRRLVVLAGALPAAAAICYAGTWHGIAVGSTVGYLACLAALVALAGRADRPSWRRLWPAGLIAVGLLAIAPLATVAWLSGILVLAMLLLAFSIASIAWIVIDARPAIAMAVFLMAIQLPLTISSLAMGGGFQVSTLFALIVTAITALAVWRLRRQSANPGRLTPTP